MRASIRTAPPERTKAQIKEKIRLRLSELAATGYWLCQACDGINTREEDDHGQPHRCSSCGSHKLTLVPAAIDPSDFIEPNDLL